MTEARDMTGSRDMGAVLADDALLDALGRGAAAPDGDGVAALLAGWRAELSTGVDSTPVASLASPRSHRAASRSPSVFRRPGSGSRRRLRPGSWPEPGSDSVRERGSGSWRRPAVAAAAALVLVAGGVALGTATATPGSPLWPVAAVVDPERADIQTADSKLADARTAIDEGRYADARRLVDQAAEAAGRVRDPRQAKRLGDEVAEVRRRLALAAPGGASGSASLAPTPKPAPAPPGRTPPTPGPHPSPGPSGSATPQPSASGAGGLLPGLPIPNLTSLLPILPIVP